jgi:hypothetical protein
VIQQNSFNAIGESQMVNFNIVNFITIGIIAILAVMAVRIGFKTMNKTAPV